MFDNIHWRLVACLAALLAWHDARAAERFAIVVGVNHSPQVRLAGGVTPRPLRGAESDADAVAALLIGEAGFPREDVRLLKGAEATHAAVAAAFVELGRRMTGDDVFVFHFSGHGTQWPDQPPNDEPDSLDEALCLADSASDGTNLLVDDELGLWLDDLPAGDVTVLLDCCHAGTGTKDPDDEVVSRGLQLTLPRVAPQPGETPPWRELRQTGKSLTARSLTALFACRPEQQAYERRMPSQTAPARSGQFTHYLLAGLRNAAADANRDGRITRREAIDYATAQLDKEFNPARSTPADRQEPQLESTAEDAPLIELTH